MTIIKVLITAIVCTALSTVYADDFQGSHGYALLGTLKYQKDFKCFDYVKADAPKGGRIKFAYPNKFDSLNPFILKGNPAPNLDYTYETLMADSLDEPASQYGLIAEKVIISKDKNQVDFILRPQAKWHDGSTITAYDVEFSFKTLRDKGHPNYKILLHEVDKIEVINDYQIKYYLKQGYSPAIIATLGAIPVISKAFFTVNDFEKTHEKPFMGSGPYKIKEYSFGKYIRYERDENYWAKDLPVNKGQYNFNEIQVDCYQDSDIAIQALLNEEYDFRQENVARIWATQYNSDAFKDGLIIKETMPSKQPANLQGLFFNLRKKVLQDVKLREAINLAYDFDWINKYLFYGSYNRLESYFHNTEFAATDFPTDKELEILREYYTKLPEEVFVKNYVIPTTEARMQKNRNNLRQAKQILIDAGYEIQGGKMISPFTQQAVELEIVYDSQYFERIFHVLKDNLAKIGITLELRYIDKTQYEQRMQKFDFDIVMGAFVPSIVPGPLQRVIWHSKSDVMGGYNLAGVHNEVVDDLVDRINKTNSHEELTYLCKALDRVLLWNYYTVLQYYSPGFRIVYWNKFERPEIKPTYNIGINTWWMKKF